MLTTRFVDGAPCWIDVGTPDAEGAASFYRALFGWTYRSAGPDGGGYGFFEHAGRIVAGCAPLGGDQGGAAWTVYFRSPDADATAEAVRAARGSVPVPPAPVGSRAGRRCSPTRWAPPSASGSPAGVRAWRRPGRPAACAGPSCTPRTSPGPPPSTMRSSAGRPPP